MLLIGLFALSFLASCAGNPNVPNLEYLASCDGTVSGNSCDLTCDDATTTGVDLICNDGAWQQVVCPGGKKILL